MFDVYTDVAAFVKWLNGTILKMGGMQACDLALEETHSKGELFKIFTFHTIGMFLIMTLNTQNLPLALALRLHLPWRTLLFS